MGVALICAFSLPSLPCLFVSNITSTALVFQCLVVKASLPLCGESWIIHDPSPGLRLAVFVWALLTWEATTVLGRGGRHRNNLAPSLGIQSCLGKINRPPRFLRFRISNRTVTARPQSRTPSVCAVRMPSWPSCPSHTSPGSPELVKSLLA